MKKTILSLLLSLGMCFGVFVAPVHAQTIGSNQTITGQTNGYTPTTYTYTMPKSGYFYYTYTIAGDTYIYHSDDTDEVKPFVSYHPIKTSMKVNYKTYVDNDSAFQGQPFTSDVYAFQKGSQIKISVWDYYRDCSTGYSLTIHYVNPKNFEKEANNSRGKAMKIQAKKTYTGIISHSEDDDWFVFKASKAGKYKVNCVVTKDHSDRINTEVYKGYKSLNSCSIREGDGWINILNSYSQKNTTVKLKKNQKLYIHIYYDYYKQTWYKLNVKKA